MARLACAIALCALAACRDIVDFDEPSAVAVLPFAPAADFKTACTACAFDHCTTQHRACLDEVQCRAMLECYSACSDPACAAHCGSYAVSNVPVQSSVYQLDRTDENANFAAYTECVVEANCRVECGLGVDWSCLNNKTYRWPTRPEPNQAEGIGVRVDVVEVNDYLGVPARVTAFASDRTQIASAQTASWGQAELNLQVAETFDGYLEIEPAIQGFGKQLAYVQPIFRPTRAVSVVFPDDAELPTPRPDTAALAALASDCLGVPAPGVTFELDQVAGQPWYTSNRSLPTPSATQTGLRGSGGISDIPATSDEVTLIAKRGGDVVARRVIRLRANWLTLVGLTPVTEDQ